ncbi:hypothetical protein [Tenacibaculum amylolyticum]|uniref:hypothetical protein n=1 Tax=Tenacibaculum amylolyticum TaxID=104269 RepID=UPI003895AF00
MTYKIKGGFNSGLHIYKEEEKIMYSLVKKEFFKNEIEIYNNNHKSLLTVKKSISGFNIENIDLKKLDKLVNIENNSIIFNLGEIIHFKKKWYDISLYPCSIIYFNNKKIGQIKPKRRIFSFNINLNLYIYDDFKDLTDYILIFILCKYSNQDHG